MTLNPEPATPTLCHVCGHPVTGQMTYCSTCDRPFHLRLREDAAGTDCGNVWINEQFLALEYACNACLGRAAAEPAVGSGH